MSDKPNTSDPDVPMAEAGARAWVESLNVAFELAVGGAEARYGMTRDEAVAWLSEVFRDEDDRNLPAKIRMARGIADAGE